MTVFTVPSGPPGPTGPTGPAATGPTGPTGPPAAVARSQFFRPGPNGNNGDHRVRNIGGTGAHRMEFQIDPNATSVTGIFLAGSPNGAGGTGAGKDVDFFSDYGNPSAGESIFFHSESDVTGTYNFGPAADAFFEIDLLPIVFTNVAAGDVCGLFIDHNGVGSTIAYYGIRVEYTAP